MSHPKEESPMATAQVLTSSPKEKRKVPKDLPASEEPFGNGIKSKVPPKEADVCPLSRRSTQMKPYKGKEHRMTIRGEIGLGKPLKGHSKDRSFKCVVCEKSFSKKSFLLIHQWRHTNSKRSAYAAYRETFAQTEQLPICSKSQLLKTASNVKSHIRKQREEGTYSHSKGMKLFFLREDFAKLQISHSPSAPSKPQAGLEHPSVNQEGRADEMRRDQSEFLLEEFTKMRQNFDQLILNQQAQLQVLQGIQKQLDILLPGNDLINFNVCSLACLWSQSAAATRSVSFPFFFNPRNLLPGSTPHFSS
ncbi:zinc finger protein 182-like [Crotalus tigris]|uniref:zinc finger protein 182-like n=1 Tax=Crotalus tigris TaxID=88082 RepID=UPI00192F655F|nr:zinc finger protein 182-like [Crotalus tigris]